MKKETIKKVIIFSILAVLGCVYAVFYILYPEATKTTTDNVLDFVCTKPLPVISISLLSLFLLVLQIIKISGIGNKSLRDCRSHLEDSKKVQEKTHEELLAFEEALNKKLDEFVAEHSENMRQICSNIPNKNVKELGEKLYGAKEENSESVEE